jgi:hypothetical protein
MTQDRNTSIFTFFRDAAIIIAALTALAYYLGYTHLYWYWRFLGLNRAIRPDFTMEEVLLRGGSNIFFTVLMVYGLSITPPIQSRLLRIVEYLKSFLPPVQVHIFCLFMVFMGATFLSTAQAWIRSRQFQNEMIMLQKLVLESGDSIPNVHELAFIGHMGSYVIFKRMEGCDQGEIIIIADSEVKSITMRHRNSTNKHINTNQKISSPLSAPPGG